MLTPSLSSLLSRRTDPTRQGGVLGVSQSLQSLARIAGPSAGIPLFYVDDALPFLLGALVALIPFGLGIGLARTPPDAVY